LKIKISTTEEMANAITLRKHLANVSGGGMTIRVHTLSSDDGIERFKGLGGEQNGWTKSAHMFCEVYKNMELRLVKPARSPACSTEKKMLDFVVQKGLEHK
jgi:hypothetical protein